jgi:hypothetical protein
MKINKLPPGEQTPGAPVGLTTGNATVDAVGQMHFEGNIVDHRWFLSPLLRHKNGLVNGTAVWVLADIVFWHRPEIIRDRHTNAITGARKKFDDDEFWQDYKIWAVSLGLTERQVRDAVSFLHAAGIVQRRSEPVTLRSGHRTNNVAIISIVPEVLHQITYGTPSPRKKRRETPHVTTGGPQRQNVRPVAPQREASTENTSQSTHKSSSSARRAVDDVSDEKLVDDLTAAGVSTHRAKKVVPSHQAELRRRLEFLPHLKNIQNPGALLCSDLDTPWQEPPAMLKAREAEAGELRAIAERRAADQRRQAAAEREEQTQNENDQLDRHYKSLSAVERKEIDDQAARRLAPLAALGITSAGALAAARRNIIRKELGMPTTDDEET